MLAQISYQSELWACNKRQQGRIEPSAARCALEGSQLRRYLAALLKCVIMGLRVLELNERCPIRH